MKFWYFWRDSFFRQNEITLWGKKRTVLFQTYNWEKSSFFQLTNHYRGFDITKKPKSFLGIRKLARCAKLCQLVLFPERHLSLASLLPRLALLSRLSHNEKWIYHWVHKRMETMYILNCTKPNVFLAVHKTHLKNLRNFSSKREKGDITIEHVHNNWMWGRYMTQCQSIRH